MGESVYGVPMGESVYRGSVYGGVYWGGGGECLLENKQF